MRADHNWATKARYYSSVSVLYLATLLFVWYIFNPLSFFRKPNLKNVSAQQIAKPSLAQFTSGKPIRIVVPHANVDLPVDEGNYDSSDGSWTLSNTNAEFAMPSMPANDKQGNTLIYGHDTPRVFAPLDVVTTGDAAVVFTDNGHKFYYIFKSAENVKPDNMNVFQYLGKPALILQTCSGNWSEWRRLYTFDFVRVE